jgi:hypothetical protein
MNISGQWDGKVSVQHGKLDGLVRKVEDVTLILSKGEYNPLIFGSKR